MRSVRIQHRVTTTVRTSSRVLEVAMMFGLGVDETRTRDLVTPCEIPLPPGGIVFITGPSGGGKSTVLELLARECAARRWPVLRCEDIQAPPDRPLVELLDRDGAGLGRSVSLLGLAGLADAFVMLRTPSELSDGERYRLRLARTIERAERECSGGDGMIIMADEFGATLDRLTAVNIARNLRRWMRRRVAMRDTFVCATSHDDLLEALEPDVLVATGLGESIEVHVR